MVNDKIWDTVIVGAGPAGLSAAIYLAREDFNVLVLESNVVGGMMSATEIIDNYPGYDDGISGIELSGKMKSQAKKYGAIIGNAKVEKINFASPKKLILEGGKVVLAKTVLLALGNDYRHLGVPGEQEMIGKNIHFCATCDGAYYKDKNIVVVGGGNSAIQETIYLSKFAKHIDLLVRSEIKASGVLINDLEKLIDKNQVMIHKPVNVLKINHDNKKAISIEIENSETNEKYDLKFDGIFEFIGLVPKTQFLQSTEIELNDSGFIKANKNKTSAEGVFVAGDVRENSVRQIAAAVGDGVSAAIEIRDYIKIYN